MPAVTELGFSGKIWPRNSRVVPALPEDSVQHAGFLTQVTVIVLSVSQDEHSPSNSVCTL